MTSYEEESINTFLVVVALAVVSGVVNIVLIAVAVAIFYRLRRSPVPKESEEIAEDNLAYAGLSDITRVDPRHDLTYDVIRKPTASL